MRVVCSAQPLRRGVTRTYPADEGFPIAGSFEIADDMRPRVIHLDFPALPTDKSKRGLKLAENGKP